MSERDFTSLRKELADTCFFHKVYTIIKIVMEYKPMNKLLRIASLIALPITLMLASHANATILTGGVNIDNSYTAYISTSDSVAGTALSSATNWPATQPIGPVSLNAGQDYFLHIAASNITGPAAFLGDFTLSGGDHLFANNSNFLTTNLTDWQVSSTGWSNYGAVTSYGTNGVSPWGNRTGVDSSAEWIWWSNVANYQSAYFTTKISAVNAASEPATAILLAAGLVLLGFRKKLSA